MEFGLFHEFQKSADTSEAEAYDVSYACAEPTTICPKYIVNDTRVPQCNVATHLCEMVQPSDAGNQ